MGEVTNTSPEGDTHDGMTPEAAAAQRTDLNTLPDDVRAYIKDLRAEAERYRKEKKQVETEKQQQERTRLEADKQWEVLAAKYKSDLDELQPKAARLAEMEQALKDSAQKRIDALPKQWRGLVPEYDDPAKTLAWLDANSAALSLPTPPNLNPGAQGDGGGADKTSKADQEALDNARRMGMGDADLTALKTFLAKKKAQSTT